MNRKVVVGPLSVSANRSSVPFHSSPVSQRQRITCSDCDSTRRRYSVLLLKNPSSTAPSSVPPELSAAHHSEKPAADVTRERTRSLGASIRIECRISAIVVPFNGREISSSSSAYLIDQIMKANFRPRLRN